MMNELTPRLLADITKDISRGRPLWGILRANEYLEQDSLLRKALLSKAKREHASQGSSDTIADIWQLLAEGKTLAEMPLALQEQIKSFREGSRPLERQQHFIPQARVRTAQRRQRVQRGAML